MQVKTKLNTLKETSEGKTSWIRTSKIKNRMNKKRKKQKELTELKTEMKDKIKLVQK